MSCFLAFLFAIFKAFLFESIPIMEIFLFNDFAMQIPIIPLPEPMSKINL